LLCVRFKLPESGWLPVELIDGEQRFVEWVSYVPNDFPGDLASAVRLALGGIDAEAVANTEPREFAFRLRPDGGVIHFDVALRIRKPWGGQTYGDSKIAVSADRLQLVGAFRSAFAELGAMVTPEEYQRRMRSPFPTATLGKLDADLAAAGVPIPPPPPARPASASRGRRASRC
jgi:hypothetical protein